MPSRSDGPETRVPGGVLTILRTLAGWRQKRLARAAGLSGVDQISDYETDRLVLPRSRAQELLALMGLPPHLLDLTIAFWRQARAAAERHRDGGPEARLAEKIDVYAEGMGRYFETVARTSAEKMVKEASILAARQQAPALWARLRPYGAAERRALVREAAELRSWALCELLCEESAKEAAHDAGEAVALAELAVEVALAVRAEEPWRLRLEGFARAFTANALRASSRLAAAGEAFEHALEVWASGAPADAYPLDASRLLDLEASLRRDQGRLSESLDLLDRALAFHPGGPAAARLLIKRAHTLEALAAHKDAIAELRRAALQLDVETEPRLVLIVRQQLAWNLGSLGRAAEAEALLPEARALAARLGSRPDSLHVRWLEGFLAEKMGRMRDAASAFEEVRAGFVALNMPCDAALATVHLASVYLQQGGRAAEVKALAAQAAPVFGAEKMPVEARKALALFRRATEENRATPELARRLGAYLERARHAPGLVFADAA